MLGWEGMKPPTHQRPRKARTPRPALPRDPHYFIPAEEDLAISGLGPRWRLLRACQKGIACPRCGEGPCTRRPICLERLWAYAAQRRREKNPIDADSAAIILKTLHRSAATGTPLTLEVAIEHGLVRLERVPDSDTEVQWVDA